MKNLGSNHRTAAAWNRGLAVRLLQQHGALSRNEISQMTGLQGSTLSYIVRELVDKEIVRISGKRQSTQVGPKQVLLTLNPGFGWLLGAALRPGLATLVLMNAAGGQIDTMQIPIRGALEAVPGQLADVGTAWMKKHKLRRDKLLGVGVGVSGVVDADAGVVLRSNPFNAVNVPLRQLLAEQFSAPVYIDHDACFGALAEATDGAAADASHFVYFAINANGDDGSRRLDSYGSALFLNGKAYRGAFYGAGELDVVLEPAPMAMADADLAELTNADGGMPSPLVELAARIGRSLAAIINLIDVQMAILAGNLRIANRRFIAAVQAEVTQRLVAIPGRAVRVVRGVWEPTAPARGAAITAYDALIRDGSIFDDGAPDRKGWNLPPVSRSADETIA